ncbi:GlcG/HbpS family heme-binding protein [Sphingomonas sp.]|jgi:uncharacterized protein GlcG (DUF336 family)|uniref:GlcG/HbpS family heme-binding protein n=1 Tax=Sphingomonas sp. TaxID=28214 RepID=UPI002D7FF2B2|nr:heme-binding protein [Sphingomonas sp.]HEU0045406.1 heme-binding protein [Sphingomonas sp.]
MLTFEAAIGAVQAAVAHGHAAGMMPLCAVVLDAGGHELALGRADGAGFYRVPIARTKAVACLGMGLDGRALAERAGKAPAFYAALASVTPGGVVPVAGGVLIRDAGGVVVGAIGISGDTSDNDEAAALAGLAAAGLNAGRATVSSATR